MDYEAEVISVDTGKPVDAPVEKSEPQTEVKEEVAEVVTEETTPEPKEEKAPTEDNLVELPDGRKLPPKEAEVEYRNLYSEFTRRSQELATYKKAPDSKITNNEPTEKSEWIPQTWEEVLEKSAQAYEEKQERIKQAELQARQQNEEYVSNQLSELKKENPNLNETQLFNHALKYNFRDLKVAYSNMKDMNSMIKKATETTAQNLQKRSAEPISGGTQGGASFDGDVYDPSARNMSMVDYLRSLK
jgi:hypothetical protein